MEDMNEHNSTESFVNPMTAQESLFLSQLSNEKILYEVQPQYISRWWFYIQCFFLILAYIFLFPFIYFTYDINSLYMFNIHSQINVGNIAFPFIGFGSTLMFQFLYLKSLKAYKPLAEKFILTNARIVKIIQTKNKYYEKDISRSKIKNYSYKLIEKKNTTFSHPFLLIIIIWILWLIGWLWTDTPSYEIWVGYKPFLYYIPASFGLFLLVLFLGYFFTNSKIEETYLKIQFNSFNSKEEMRFDLLIKGNRYHMNYFSFMRSGVKITPEQIENAYGTITSFTPSINANYRSEFSLFDYSAVGIHHGPSSIAGHGLNKLLWFKLIFMKFDSVFLLFGSLIMPILFHKILFVIFGLDYTINSLHLICLYMFIAGLIYITIYSVIIFKRVIFNISDPKYEKKKTIIRSIHFIFSSIFMIFGIISVISTLIDLNKLSFTDNLLRNIFPGIFYCIFYFLLWYLLWSGFTFLLMIISVFNVGKHIGTFHADSEKLTKGKETTSTGFKVIKEKYQCFSNQFIPVTEYNTTGFFYKPLRNFLTIFIFNLWITFIYLTKIKPLISEIDNPFVISMFSIIIMIDIIFMLKNLMLFKINDDNFLKFGQMDFKRTLERSHEQIYLLSRIPSQFVNFSNIMEEKIHEQLLRREISNKEDLKLISENVVKSEIKPYENLNADFLYNLRLFNNAKEELSKDGFKSIKILSRVIRRGD